MDDCIFCRIAKGNIPSNIVYEDAHVVAFNDLSPQAPVHVLIVPRAHAANILEAEAFPDAALAALLRAVPAVARKLGLDERGFRIVSNCGGDACQSVAHLHIHLLGGAQLPAELV